MNLRAWGFTSFLCPSPQISSPTLDCYALKRPNYCPVVAHTCTWAPPDYRRPQHAQIDHLHNWISWLLGSIFIYFSFIVLCGVLIITSFDLAAHWLGYWTFLVIYYTRLRSFWSIWWTGGHSVWPGRRRSGRWTCWRILRRLRGGRILSKDSSLFWLSSIGL